MYCLLNSELKTCMLPSKPCKLPDGEKIEEKILCSLVSEMIVCSLLSDMIVCNVSRLYVTCHQRETNAVIPQVKEFCMFCFYALKEVCGQHTQSADGKILRVDVF